MEQLNPNTIGIEIETSAIKIKSPGSEKLGFIISDNQKDSWMIEEDTLDVSLDKTKFEEFNQNLECKTIGGFSKDQFLKVILDMENIFKTLYQSAQENPVEVTPSYLSNLIQNIKVRPKNGQQEKFMVKAKNSDQDIRPQITYKLSLEDIPLVFQRLAELKHDKIVNFLKSLDPRTELTLKKNQVENKIKSKLKLQRNAGRTQEIQLLLRSNFSHLLPKLKEKKAIGFCYLFLYYWHEVFNNKEKLEELEPGLKQFLAIMSRIPLSQIYENLNQSEKQEVNQTLLPVLKKEGKNYKIIEYDNYGSNLAQSNLTIDQWFGSIMDPVKNGQKIGGRYVDLLSPPPGLVRPTGKIPFSIGVMDIKETNGKALIEVRGYAKIKIENNSLKISDINDFVKKESDWFFSYITQ